MPGHVVGTQRPALAAARRQYLARRNAAEAELHLAGQARAESRLPDQRDDALGAVRGHDLVDHRLANAAERRQRRLDEGALAVAECCDDRVLVERTLRLELGDSLRRGLACRLLLRRRPLVEAPADLGRDGGAGLRVEIAALLQLAQERGGDEGGDALDQPRR